MQELYCFACLVAGNKFSLGMCLEMVVENKKQIGSIQNWCQKRYLSDLVDTILRIKLLENTSCQSSTNLGQPKSFFNHIKNAKFLFLFNPLSIILYSTYFLFSFNFIQSFRISRDIFFSFQYFQVGPNGHGLCLLIIWNALLDGHI